MAGGRWTSFRSRSGGAIRKGTAQGWPSFQGGLRTPRGGLLRASGVVRAKPTAHHINGGCRVREGC